MMAAMTTPADRLDQRLNERRLQLGIRWKEVADEADITYKYRSDYLKPFGSDFGQTNRYVQATKSLDLSLAYNLSANLQIKLQALNLANDAYVEYRVANDAFNRIEYSGRRYFLGLRFRM